MKNLLLTISLLSSSFMMAQTDATFVSNNNLYHYISNYPNTTTTTESESIPLEEVDITVAKKITYNDHLHEAESFDIPLILNDEQMDSLVLANHLVTVPEEGEGYKIQKLTHSKAYLNETSYLILKEISSIFYKETGVELSISSLTRTLENQNKLRRVNSNAAKGDSSHNYGASFDISYSKYGDKNGRNYANEKLLQSILEDFAADGKIYFIKERRQPCFHITVRNFNPKMTDISKK